MKHRSSNSWRTHHLGPVRAAVEQLEERNALSANMLTLLTESPHPLLTPTAKWEMTTKWPIPADTDFMASALDSPVGLEPTLLPLSSEGKSGEGKFEPPALGTPDPSDPVTSETEGPQADCPTAPGEKPIGEDDPFNPKLPELKSEEAKDCTILSEPGSGEPTDSTSLPDTSSDASTGVSMPGITEITSVPDLTSRTNAESGLDSSATPAGTTSKSETHQLEPETPNLTATFWMGPLAGTSEPSDPVSWGPPVVRSANLVNEPERSVSAPIVNRAAAPLTGTLNIGPSNDSVLPTGPLVSATNAPLSPSVLPGPGQWFANELQATRPTGSPPPVAPANGPRSFFASTQVSPLSIAGQASYDPLVTFVLHRRATPNDSAGNRVPVAAHSSPSRPDETDVVFARELQVTTSKQSTIPRSSQPTFGTSDQPDSPTHNRATHLTVRRVRGDAPDASQVATEGSWLATWRPYWNKLVALSSGSFLFLPFAQRPRKEREAESKRESD